MSESKIRCSYCGRTVRRGTKPYRDLDGQQYHAMCFREMTDDSYEKPVLGRERTP
jgi:hypothetical protein